MFICACSDVGKMRNINQDAVYYVDDEKLPIYMVADGMGGHKSGEYASNLSIHVISRMYDEKREAMASGELEIPQFINDAFKAANEKIVKEGAEDETIKKMGTTLTLIIVKEGEAYIGHIGDSRAYMIRGGELTQLTHDHSLVAELLRSGSITAEEARVHPQKNVITKALGTDSDINPDIYTKELLKDDILFLCTDGLTNMIEDEDLKNKILMASELQEMCVLLTNEANELGGPDNITILMAKIS
jgi:PPM family protein phosphatase